jgi:adenosylhomocysteine nucleosidase
MSGGIAAVSSLVMEARVAAGAGVFAVCSQGQRLAAALESAVARGGCGIISFGVAGGLAPGLAPGDWVVATGVITGRRFFPTDPARSRSLRERLPNAAHADILGMDEGTADPERKQLLYARTGAVAIDMESHIAAKVAAACRIPFAASRVIIDPAERALPHAAWLGCVPMARPTSRRVPVRPAAAASAAGPPADRPRCQHRRRCPAPRAADARFGASRSKGAE